MRWDRGTPPVGSHLPHNLRLCKGPSSDTVTHLMFLQLHICWFTGFRALLWCFHPDVPVFEVEKQVWSLKRELLGASDSGIWWWRRRIWWRQWWQLTMFFQKKQSRACSLDSETRHFKVWHLGDLGGIIVKDFKDWLLQQISIRVWTTSHSSFSFDGFYMSQSQSNPFGEIYSILSIPPYIHIQTYVFLSFLHFVHHCSAEGTTANIRTFSGTCAETQQISLKNWSRRGRSKSSYDGGKTLLLCITAFFLCHEHLQHLLLHHCVILNFKQRCTEAAMWDLSLQVGGGSDFVQNFVVFFKPLHARHHFPFLHRSGSQQDQRVNFAKLNSLQDFSNANRKTGNQMQNGKKQTKNSSFKNWNLHWTWGSSEDFQF